KHALHCSTMKTCLKKACWGMTAGLIAYALGLVLMNYLYRANSASRFWLILLPVLPLVYITSCVIRAVSERDEMQRKIVTEAMAFSGLATGFTCFSYLFLRDAGAPEFHAEWAFYIMWAYYGIGFLFSWSRYR